MYAVASVLCRTLQMSFNVDPGVRYFSFGPTISALASERRKVRCRKREKFIVRDGKFLITFCFNCFCSNLAKCIYYLTLHNKKFQRTKFARKNAELRKRFRSSWISGPSVPLTYRHHVSKMPSYDLQACLQPTNEMTQRSLHDAQVTEYPHELSIINPVLNGTTFIETC